MQAMTRITQNACSISVKRFDLAGAMRIKLNQREQLSAISMAKVIMASIKSIHGVIHHIPETYCNDL
jgi:hypothetical protein